MLFVSQPKGVGFSFCDDAKRPADCQNDDLTSAQDAYDFFLAFFDAYPEYATNDFYLTAESYVGAAHSRSPPSAMAPPASSLILEHGLCTSYGGIYIPTFMKIVDDHGGLPNLKGAAIGDGCWGTDVGLCAFSTGKAQEIQVEFFAGHGMYSQTLYSDIHAACGNFSDADVQESQCADLLDKMNREMGDFFM